MDIRADDDPWRVKRTLLAATASLLIATVLTAQEAARSSGAGQVLDRDGKGVAGAEVTFVHRPIPWCADYGEADVVHATADASGRFRVQLLQKRSYSAFASWHVDGKPKVTAVGEHVIAGAFATLREQQDDIAARTFRVEGLDAWTAFGPFTFRVVPRLPDLYLLSLVPGPDGAIALPPLPGSYALFEVVGATGDTLWQGGIGFAPDSKWPVRVPPPIEVPVEVVDGEHGTLVANAVIRHRSGWNTYWVCCNLDAADYSRECWRVAGRTDEHGRATIQVPGEAGPWSTSDVRKQLYLALAIRADGFAEQMAGWNQGKPYFDQEVQSQNPQPMRIPLRRQRPVQGRLTLDEKRSAAGIDVLLFSEARCHVSPNSWSSSRAPVQVARTDQQGRFEFPAAGRGAGSIRIGVPTWTGPLGETTASWRVPATLMAVPFAAAGRDNGREEVERNLGTESLGFDRTFRMRMVDAEDRPVQGAEIGLEPAATALAMLAQRVVTDTAGRCDVLLPPGEWFLWSVSREDGFVLQRLRVDADAVQREQMLVRQPYRWATGTVMADGRPVGGASLHSMSTSSRGGPGDGRDWLLENAGSRINQSLLSSRSDAAGRFRMPYVAVRGLTMGIDIGVSRDGKRLQASFQLPCDPDEHPEPFAVELAPAPQRR